MKKIGLILFVHIFRYQRQHPEATTPPNEQAIVCLIIDYVFRNTILF